MVNIFGELLDNSSKLHENYKEWQASSGLIVLNISRELSESEKYDLMKMDENYLVGKNLGLPNHVCRPYNGLWTA